LCGAQAVGGRETGKETTSPSLLQFAAGLHSVSFLHFATHIDELHFGHHHQSQITIMAMRLIAHIIFCLLPVLPLHLLQLLFCFQIVRKLHSLLFCPPAGKEVRQYITRATGDFRGLGRWNSWLIQADPSDYTQMVVAYQVGQAWQGGIRTIYQQHARYMNLRGIPGTPRSLFQADIMAAITKWKERGKRLIIFIDMNEHILHSMLPREFF
jgi:hypothetical protein